MSGLERRSGLAFIPAPHLASILLWKVSPGQRHPASRRALVIFLYSVQEPSYTRGYHHPLQGSIAFFLPPAYANMLQNSSTSRVPSHWAEHYTGQLTELSAQVARCNTRQLYTLIKSSGEAPGKIQACRHDIAQWLRPQA